MAKKIVRALKEAGSFSYDSDPDPTAKPIQISGEIDFEKLLKRLSDDIFFAPAFLRIGKQLGENFEKYRDEVNQAGFFWSMVVTAVGETGRSGLARLVFRLG